MPIDLPVIVRSITHDWVRRVVSTVNNFIIKQPLNVPNTALSGPKYLLFNNAKIKYLQPQI
jgi:hypothetical protein